LKKVITNFIEKATAINKYQYQFNPRIGAHSFATINPKKSPAKPMNLVSMNGKVNPHILIIKGFFISISF